MKEYQEFLKSKSKKVKSTGFEVDKESLNPCMYDYQKDVVAFCLKKGKANIFSDCGTGKTIMQLEWIDQVLKHTGGKGLILAPLAVADQTFNEAEKFGYENVKVVKDQSECIDGINITNYEKLSHFDGGSFNAIVLDESSILKAYTGKVRTEILETFKDTPYKLACTATPAPNDYAELANHVEFCNVMSRGQMLSKYFVHDSSQTSKWNLKGHAEKDFWRWLSSFSVFLDDPRKLGYQVEGFDLPELRIHQIVVDPDTPEEKGKMTLSDRRQARKDSLDDRCLVASDLANSTHDQWLVWCDLNAESDRLHSLIPDSAEVKGSDKPEHKKESLIGFSNEDVRVLVTKPSIAGFGMNWQNCNKMIFTGLSDSYEQYYQAIRRCWRFGQTKPVDVFIVTSQREGAIKENIERKQKDFERMQKEMTNFSRMFVKENLQTDEIYHDEFFADQKLILPEWSEFYGCRSGY